MHFIDYIPWPIYILVLILSGIIIMNYMFKEKKLSIGEKIGYFTLIIGEVSLIILKISEKTSFYFKYYNVLVIFLAAVIPGIVLAGVGVYKRSDDVEKKRRILLSGLSFCILATLFGIFILYLWITEG